MAPHIHWLRDCVLAALGVGLAIVLIVVFGLTMGGMFSWVWLARAMLVTAMITGILEFFVLSRALRVRHVRGPLSSWRRNDPTQGCTVALLGGLIAIGLVLCGGVMDWWLEWK
jgi:hypothetical protein